MLLSTTLSYTYNWWEEYCGSNASKMNDVRYIQDYGEKTET